MVYLLPRPAQELRKLETTRYNIPVNARRIWWARPDSNREPRDYEGEMRLGSKAGWKGSHGAPATLYAVFVLDLTRLKKA
jgi:hypothetical protein